MVQGSGLGCTLGTDLGSGGGQWGFTLGGIDEYIINDFYSVLQIYMQQKIV
jgi:hypothetical protein